jgi:hypothetical protein
METKRMEGTTVHELAEDAAEVLVELEKTLSLDGGGI